MRTEYDTEVERIVFNLDRDQLKLFNEFIIPDPKKRANFSKEDDIDKVRYFTYIGYVLIPFDEKKRAHDYLKGLL